MDKTEEKTHGLVPCPCSYEEYLLLSEKDKRRLLDKVEKVLRRKVVVNGR